MTKKKWCGLILAIAMVFSSLTPFGAAAAEQTVTLHDETTARVTLQGATGQNQRNAPVYEIASDLSAGTAKYTFAQDFSSWSGQWWQDKMWLQMSGSDLIAGDALSFQVKASSETVAKQVVEKLNIEFRTSTGDGSGKTAGDCGSYAVKTKEPNTYRFEIPYTAFVFNNTPFTPAKGSAYYLTVTFKAQDPETSAGLAIQNEWIEYADFAACRRVDTPLEMTEADRVSVSVESPSGLFDVTVTNNLPADARAYTGISGAKLELHRDALLTLTAQSAPGKLFSYWEKDGSEYQSEKTVTVSGDDLTDGASFTAVYRDLPTEAEDGTPIFHGVPWTSDTAGSKLQLTLDGETLINRVSLNESTTGSVQTFHLEVLQNGEWVTVYDNDYIAHDRNCILPEDVTTSAVRLVADTLNGSTTITDFTADYQASIENADFMNLSYVSCQWYEKGQFGYHSEQYNTATDIIMLGNFRFDSAGNFKLVPESRYNTVPEANQNRKDDIVGLDPTSDDAVGLMNGWVETVKNGIPRLKNGDSRLWISLTGNDNAKQSAAFNTEETRRKFAQDVAAFAVKYGLYGVDVDWEYPNPNQQAINAFRAMLAALSEELHKAGVKLSCTLCPAYKENLRSQEFAVLDYVYWMTYTNVKNEAKVKGQVPYYHMRELVENSISRGCDPGKIIVGLPYFGKPAGKPAATFSSLYATYQQKHEDQPFPKGLNRIDMNGDAYYYNGAYLLQDKVAYAADLGCAGVFTWWPSQDIQVFADGETREMGSVTAKGEDSLVRAVYEAVRRFTGVNPIRTDYTEMEAELEKVPEDLTDYTPESAAKLQEAVDAIDWNLNYLATEQARYDKQLQALKDAIAGLEYQTADYTAVDAALQKAPEDLSGYTEETAKAVKDAVQAVERGLPITEQARVDAMAKAIEDAVAALQKAEKPTVLGDVNGDGEVDVTDALAILRMAVGLSTPTANADMDGMNGVTVTDALAALRIAVGLA